MSDIILCSWCERPAKRQWSHPASYWGPAFIEYACDYCDKRHNNALVMFHATCTLVNIEDSTLDAIASNGSYDPAPHVAGWED